MDELVLGISHQGDNDNNGCDNDQLPLSSFAIRSGDKRRSGFEAVFVHDF
jgi:hypothetical protein